MEIRLPSDKLTRTLALLQTCLPKKKATKREILSLVGTLQHATKVVRPRRAFVARMYATASKLCKVHFSTRLNRDFRSDLLWWHTFLQLWNGLSILRHSRLSFTPNFVAYVYRCIRNVGLCSCAWLSMVGVHRFQILPILQVPSTAVKCIHKYKYRYRYMETL